MGRDAKRLLIVSNRLPVSVEKSADGLRLRRSVGGLVTGLKSFYQSHESVWIGWPGIVREGIQEEMGDLGARLMSEHSCYPVFLSQVELDQYYYGFSNKTLWPLFHYFTQYAAYDEDFWTSYERANRVFADTVSSIARPTDTIWVHDYHLLLLPRMIREKLPEADIGFFLHIPFPSFEIFRLLPWRRQLLDGVLGSDLVGFHTSDYARHFLSSVHRLLGHEYTLGQVTVGNRVVKVDAFPMGIDYDRFSQAKGDKNVQKKITEMRSDLGEQRMILSIDRLDYSKGILERLAAYDTFLRRSPACKGGVTFILVTVPSREQVDHYESLKRQIEETIGKINGEHGTFGWTPIRYVHRPQSFEDLVALYSVADVYMVTPLRDGMNLMAKEYIASKANGTGVLILSEMAGAAKELGEAIIVNANDNEQVVEALERALDMTEEDKVASNVAMRERIRRYNVVRWSQDFLDALDRAKRVQREMRGRLLSRRTRRRLKATYRSSKRRLWLLDYDGTLVPFADKPDRARPGRRVLDLLGRLAKNPKNELVLVSGRNRETLEAWFGELAIGLVAEHGVWVREPAGDWEMIEPLVGSWKDEVRPILELYADRTPGALIEEKDFSLVWHYRRTDSELGVVRVRELTQELEDAASKLGLHVLQGSKVVEIKNAGINKGRAALRWLAKKEWDLIVSIGDDVTDEDVFAVLPERAYSIKVGLKPSQARSALETPADVVSLLEELVSGGDDDT
jgi:trehalose 6-phosphate synthase/phosphatase